MQTSGAMCREIANYIHVIAGAAKRAITGCRAMIFPEIAMTTERRGVLDPRLRGDDRRGSLQCHQMAPSETLICPA